MSIVIPVLVVLAAITLLSLVLSAVAGWRHPPSGRFVDCGGIRLHYVERGSPDAPPVVALHGNGAMIQDMEACGLVDLLAPRFRVICFDRPGFGHSARPRGRRFTPERQADLFAVALRQLGVADPVVVGHSWGTLVALAFALRGEARGLVLVAGYYFPTRRLDLWIASVPAVPVLGDILRYTILPLLGRLVAPLMVRRLFAPRAVPARFTAGFPMALALRPTPLRATGEESALMAPAAARMQVLYRGLSCPVEVFCAAGDTVVESDQGPRLHALLEGSTLHVVPDAGHMLHYAVPRDIAAAVERVSAAGRAAG